MLSRILIVGLLLTAAVAAAGCTASAEVGCPSSSNKGVSSTPGAFSMGMQVSCSHDTAEYKWNNSGARARVSLGSQVASGSLKVEIKDSVGTSVFSQTFSSTSNVGQSVYTSPGTPGSWTIIVTVTDYTGNLGLSVTTS